MDKRLYSQVNFNPDFFLYIATLVYKKPIVANRSRFHRDDLVVISSSKMKKPATITGFMLPRSRFHRDDPLVISSSKLKKPATIAGFMLPRQDSNLRPIG